MNRTCEKREGEREGEGEREVGRSAAAAPGHGGPHTLSERHLRWQGGVPEAATESWAKEAMAEQLEGAHTAATGESCVPAGEDH